MALMGLCFATSAVAQQRPMVEMLSEADTEGLRRCGVNHAGLEAAVAGALRRNGFRISQQRANPFAMVAHVTANTVGMQSFCSLTLKVTFFFSAVSHAPWGQRYFLDHVICSKVYTITGPPDGTLQARLINYAIELTEICISEENRNRRG